jgi:hypothetical protein
MDGRGSLGSSTAKQPPRSLPQQIGAGGRSCSIPAAAAGVIWETSLASWPPSLIPWPSKGLWSLSVSQ